MELRAVTAAQRPCASQLLDCQGLAETFVKNAALAEATQRAKDAEKQLKERDQQIAQILRSSCIGERFSSSPQRGGCRKKCSSSRAEYLVYSDRWCDCGRNLDLYWANLSREPPKKSTIAESDYALDSAL